jgi:hypothetical protein
LLYYPLRKLVRVTRTFSFADGHDSSDSDVWLDICFSNSTDFARSLAASSISRAAVARNASASRRSSSDVGLASVITAMMPQVGC